MAFPPIWISARRVFDSSLRALIFAFLQEIQMPYGDEWGQEIGSLAKEDPGRLHPDPLDGPYWVPRASADWAGFPPSQECQLSLECFWRVLLYIYLLFNPHCHAAKAGRCCMRQDTGKIFIMVPVLPCFLLLAVGRASGKLWCSCIASRQTSVWDFM